MTEEIPNPSQLHQLVMKEINEIKAKRGEKPIRFFAKPGSKTYEQIWFCANRAGLTPNEWLRSFIDWGYNVCLIEMSKNNESVVESVRQFAQTDKE